jgi:hypothetical protein
VSGPWHRFERSIHQTASLKAPFSTPHSPLSTLHSPLSTLHSPLSTLHSPLSTLRSSLSTLLVLLSLLLLPSAARGHRQEPLRLSGRGDMRSESESWILLRFRITNPR